jgi:Mg2+ and Co2+ transporter CorA
MQGLYEGYHNLIQRIMEPKHTTSSSRSISGLGAGVRGVVLADSANLRFERLGDRIQLLILSGTKEFLAEKEALISMYFNINTQKDSEATARLTRSATLLAKLSVLFLPVSLMTGYFSVQIDDIQGVYTIKEYWIVFAVIMSISFVGLFFFSRLLMWVTETLDEWIKSFNQALGRLFIRRRAEKDD